MESLVDELAYAAGVDLLTARKVNLPERDRAVYERQLDRVAKEIGWAEHQNKSHWDTSDAPVKVGIGFGLSTWGGGGGPECEVDVRIERSGAVSALCGTQDLGTGSRTLMVAIVAEEFGLEPSAVTAQIGDSRLGKPTARAAARRRPRSRRRSRTPPTRRAWLPGGGGQGPCRPRRTSSRSPTAS
jgi:xanthine dehydrogenase YagR molybdenum-binding subunit